VGLIARADAVRHYSEAGILDDTFNDIGTALDIDAADEYDLQPELDFYFLTGWIIRLPQRIVRFSKPDFRRSWWAPISPAGKLLTSLFPPGDFINSSE
jgi:hypothetical protein